MGIFLTFENAIADQVVELQRRLGATIQPAAISHRLVGAMEAHKEIRINLTVAANRFAVRLAPVDHRSFAGREDELASSLANELRVAGTRRGYAFLSNPIVELIADAAVPAGQIWIDSAIAVPGREPRSWNNSHRTRQAPPEGVSARVPASSRPGRSWLRALSGGLGIFLAVLTSVEGIGRAADTFGIGASRRAPLAAEDVCGQLPLVARGTAWISCLYMVHLNRPASPWEIQAWRERHEQADDIVVGIKASDEAREVTAKARVRELYANCLGRRATERELDAWIARLRANAYALHVVDEGVTRSDEARRRGTCR